MLVFHQTVFTCMISFEPARIAVGIQRETNGVDLWSYHLLQGGLVLFVRFLEQAFTDDNFFLACYNCTVEDFCWSASISFIQRYNDFKSYFKSTTEGCGFLV